MVAGWTAPRRSRKYFGALVLGLYRGGQLRFIGSVGTGFDEKKQKQIFDALQEMHVEKSALQNAPRLAEKTEWVRPEMVARVKFANWTDDEHLRAPVFFSLRTDKLAKSCTFDAEHVEPEKSAIRVAEPAKAAKTAARKTCLLYTSRCV